MGTSTQELTFRVGFDPSVATREMRNWTTSVEANLRQVTFTERQQVAAAQALQRQRSAAIIALWKQEEREASRSARTRLQEESRALRQKIAEENRAAREVARITAETARQAAAQERIRERAAKQLADAQIREAKRAARELERSLATGRGSSDGSFDLSGLTNITGQIPLLGRVTSQLSSVTTASTAAGAATAGLAGPIGIAVAAFLAEAAAVAAVGKGLFDLAKQTADFQGKLFDMSQQVGISVETLSALEVLATTTGGNIETVAASIAIFQRNLEQAHDPTSTEGKLLQELGVTATNTEEALRQTIAGLFALGEGSRQTDAALQLFGRSGRFVNAILKESQGDLDKAIRKFRELGIIVGTEDAKAADEFNDSLAVLNFQIRGLTAEVGNQLVPIITRGLREVQRIVKENKDGIEALGVILKGVTVLIGGPLVGAIQTLGFFWKGHQPVIEAIIEKYEQLAAVLQLVTNRVPEVDPNAIPVQPLGGGAEDGLALLRRAQEAWLKSLKPFNLREIFPDKAVRGGVRAGASVERETDTERATKATEDFIRTLDRELATLKLENTAFFQRRNVFKEEAVAITLTSQAYDKLTESQKLSILERAREVGQVERQNAAAQLYANFLEQQNEITNRALGLTDAFTDGMKELERALGRVGVKLSADQKFWAEFSVFTRIVAERLAKINEEIDRMVQRLPLPEIKFPELPEEDRAKAAGAAADVFAGAPPPVPVPPDLSPWRDFEIEMVEVSERIRSSIVPLNEILAGSFLGVADAIGQVVANWVLYGETGPAVLRKVLAVALANLAKEATVNAIKELALGFATLFINPAEAASHFTASAIWGSIAGVSAVVGRGVAGDTFKQQKAGDGGSGREGSQEPQQLNPITLGRNQPQSRQMVEHRHTVVVEVKDSEFGRAVTAAIKKDYLSNGVVRQLILNDDDT